jgi:hypothetical protein
MGEDRCEQCEARDDAAQAAAVSEHERLLSGMPSGRYLDSGEVARIRELERTIPVLAAQFQQRRASAYTSLLAAALADDVLTPEEEMRLLEQGAALFDAAERPALHAIFAEYRVRLLIATVNAGRLPYADPGGIVTKKGERVHVHEAASVLKEVVNREYQAGSRGVSFRIMKGVTYRVGATRGRMVEVGRSWQPEDSGELAVTSRRLLFTGDRRTIEVPLQKILDLNLFDDAVQVHVSGRQTPHTFQVPSGPLVAAVLNAVIQPLLEGDT